MIELIDTHAHLPSLNHKPLEKILSDAHEQGVGRVVTIGAGDGISSAWACAELTNKVDNVWASIGVHPHDAAEYQNLDALAELAENPKIVAVGETGLDFYRDWSPFSLQRKLFEASISFAKTLKKPLIIHCRDAMAETVEALRRMQAWEVGGVFHCYAGDAEDAKKLKDLNFLVSFTGVLTFKNAAALRSVSKEIPLDQIMLETDCPYMAPTPYRGEPSEPMHVRLIAEKLAEVREISLEEVASATTENAERLFRLPRS